MMNFGLEQKKTCNVVPVRNKKPESEHDNDSFRGRKNSSHWVQVLVHFELRSVGIMSNLKVIDFSSSIAEGMRASVKPSRKCVVLTTRTKIEFLTESRSLGEILTAS